MNKFEEFVLNKESISNILSVRYDPTQKPLLPELRIDDFTSGNIHVTPEHIESLIKKSMADKLLNLRRVSIALSGGVDSTLMLAIFKDLNPDIEINSVSIRFANSVDETPIASKISEKYGIKQHIVEVDNYLSELPKAISIIGMPFWDLHWYHVIKKAHSISDGIISGDGGDEIFGGYTFRYKKFLSLITTKSIPLEKVKAYLHCHERDWVPDQNQLFGSKIDFTWNLIFDRLIPYFDNDLDPLDQVLLADYNSKLLYNFSPINSRIQSYFEIVSIAPLLSQEIISYASHIPNDLKYDRKNDIGKILLRQILDKHQLSEFIPKEKYGFNVSTVNLWKSYGKTLCDYYLSKSSIVHDGWINQDWITRYINKEDLDVRYINKFLGLLAFEIWYRLFISKEMKPDQKL